jgi:ribose transport system substrate-binding protein
VSTSKARIGAAIAACMGMGLVLAACGSSGNSTKTSTDSAVGKTVVVLTGTDSVAPWSAAANHEMIKDFKADGVKATFLEDPANAALQAQHFTQAIALKPDLIITDLLNPQASLPSLIAAKRAGIPVIAWDAYADAADTKYLVQANHADDYQLGQIAGEELVAGLKKAGYAKANIMADEGSSDETLVQERMTAFEKVLSAYPQYKLVSVQDSNWDSTTAQQQAAQTLAQWKPKGGIQGMYGMADYMTTVMVSAAKTLGLKVGMAKGDLVVAGGNCDEAGVQAVQAGILAGDSTQTPDVQADGAVLQAIHFLEGKKVPAVFQQSETEITQTTASQFLAACNE